MDENIFLNQLYNYFTQEHFSHPSLEQVISEDKSFKKYEYETYKTHLVFHQ